MVAPESEQNLLKVLVLDALDVLTLIFSLLYLFNMTVLVGKEIELIPDDIPMYGNADEAIFTVILCVGFRYFGCDIISMVNDKIQGLCIKDYLPNFLNKTLVANIVLIIIGVSSLLYLAVNNGYCEILLDNAVYGNVDEMSAVVILCCICRYFGFDISSYVSNLRGAAMHSTKTASAVADKKTI